MIEGKKCSNVVLKTRKIGKWVDVSTNEIFKGKKVILIFITRRIYTQHALKNSYLDLKKIMINS